MNKLIKRKGKSKDSSALAPETREPFVKKDEDGLPDLPEGLAMDELMMDDNHGDDDDDDISAADPDEPDEYGDDLNLWDTNGQLSINADASRASAIQLSQWLGTAM